MKCLSVYPARRDAWAYALWTTPARGKLLQRNLFTDCRLLTADCYYARVHTCKSARFQVCRCDVLHTEVKTLDFSGGFKIEVQSPDKSTKDPPFTIVS